MPTFTSAFAIGQVTIKDQLLWQEYKTALTETLAIYHGKVLFRGGVSQVLAGNSNHTDVVLIQFSTIEALNHWFYSDQYQAIIPLRDSAAEVTLISYAP